MQSIIYFQQSAHTILCRMKNFWNPLLLTDVAELLPNHIQIPIGINNLCYTSKIKLSAKVGMYGLLQNMHILIIQKINVSFPYFFVHVPTMCK